MRIRHLRYFLIVAEEQSFARAATRVHIEPSPLSRAIKDLESELGARLLDRTNGRIRLTWAGEVFREEARRMLTLMENARVRVKDAAQGYRGQLRIGLADRLAQPRLAKLLARCREDEPLTAIRLIEMTVNDMVSALLHDQIDAGFTVHAEPGKELHTRIVWLDRPAMAIPRNHPLLSFQKVPLNEAARYPMILYQQETASGAREVIHRWFREAAVPPPANTAYVSGHETMMILVAAGYGIGVGLESEIAIYNYPDVIVRAVADDLPNAPTFIAVRDQPPSEELNRFIARAQYIGEITGV